MKKYAQSHQNDPLGAALAKTVLRTIREEGLIDRGRDIAALLAAGLEDISVRYGRIKEIRGRGLMTAIEFYDDAVDSFTSSIHRELVHRGFLVGRRPGAGVLRLDPSLTIAPEDIEDFLQALDDLLCDRL